MSLFEIGSSASSARAFVWSGASELSRYCRRRTLSLALGTELKGAKSRIYFATAVNPLDQRIVQEGLENGTKTVFVGPENAKRDLGGSSIDACGQRRELPLCRVCSKQGRTYLRHR